VRSRRLVRGLWCCALGLGLAAPARAQTAASLRLESDYRVRGESLSDGRPAAHLSLGWDAPGGAFAGLTAGTVRLGSRDHGTQLTAYAGHAWRGDGARPGWEIGALATHFSAAGEADYAELFAGLLGPGWNLRLYLSPDYYGRGSASAYLEFETAAPLAPGWRALLHAGALGWLGEAPAGLPRTRADLRLGVARTWAGTELQLAWTLRSGPALYPYDTPRPALHGAWVLAWSVAF
jgi:uncharacterized protein (TIGR02001 family)